MTTKTKKLIGILLTLALVLGLLPGMTLTAYADNDPPYASLKNTTTEITFDGKPWYLINYDASTVTLLAKECVATTKYNSSGSFVEYSSNPTIKTAVDKYYTDSISADAKTAVSGGMFLLTEDQAKHIITNRNVRMCSQYTGNEFGMWWLCSQGYGDNRAAVVVGTTGSVDGDGNYVKDTLGVRPALKLDLNKVTFDSTTNTFALPATPYLLWVGDKQVTSANAEDATGTRGWSYDADSNILRLTGVTITTGHGYAGICYEGTEKLNIVLENKNEISVSKRYGIQSENGAIEISGNGSLTTTGSYYGIYSINAGITITSGTVTANGGNQFAGIYGKKMTITGGIVTASGGSGISGDQLTITGGTVKTTGNGTDIASAGIDADTLLEIRGGDVIANGKRLGIFLSGESKITGGIITALGENWYGIELFKHGSLSIEGGTVVASGKEMGIAFSSNVKNTIPGTGWTDMAGTQGMADIAISTGGQNLNDYKKVQFPAVSIYSTVSITNAEHTVGDGNGTVVTVTRKPDDSKTFDNFEGVEMDGKSVSADNYTKVKGSLILTLKASYLDTLSAGDHTVTVKFKDGTATAALKVSAAATPTAAPTTAPTPTPKPVPKTGDTGNPFIWLLIVLLGVSLLGITVKQYSRK